MWSDHCELHMSVHVQILKFWKRNVGACFCELPAFGTIYGISKFNLPQCGSPQAAGEITMRDSMNFNLLHKYEEY